MTGSSDDFASTARPAPQHRRAMMKAAVRQQSCSRRNFGLQRSSMPRHYPWFGQKDAPCAKFSSLPLEELRQFAIAHETHAHGEEDRRGFVVKGSKGLLFTGSD